jgi:hypothetical protein
MLSCTTFPRILAKTTKSKIVEHMVEVWSILHILLTLVNLEEQKSTICNCIFSFLILLRSLAVASLPRQKMKTGMQSLSRFLQLERDCNFKELRGFGVNLCRFPGCTKCGHTLIDEPHSNKAKVKQNSELQKKWKSNWEAVDNFLKGDGPPVVIDGKNVTKIPNPKCESEIIVCHFWQHCASKFVGGQKCSSN